MPFPDESDIARRQRALRAKRANHEATMATYRRCRTFGGVALLAVEEVRRQWYAGESSPISLTVAWSSTLHQGGWDTAAAALAHELKRRTWPTVGIAITRIQATDSPGANLRLTIKEVDNV